MKKLITIIFLSISISGYSQFVFKNGKSTARIDTIATNGNYFYFINRTTNQICQAQVRNQALVVQNIYTFTDSLTTLRAFRDSINALKLTLSTKFDYGDTVSILETQYHAAQTYLKINPDSISTPQLRTSLIKFNDGTSMSTASTGSTIYASDGVYLDGDTVKLGGELTQDVSIYGNNSLSISTLGGIFANLQDGTKYNTLNVYNPNDTARIDLSVSDGVNTSSIALTTDGLAIDFDTTLTTPNHLMTEQQVKREIAAADDWKQTDGGIKYTLDNNDSITIKSDGHYTSYISGTKRISLNPRVTSTGSAVAYLFDTHNLLTTGDRLLSIRRQGTEITGFDISGILTNLIRGGQTTLTIDGASPAYHIDLISSSTTRARFNPNVPNGATAVSYLFDTHNNLTTTGAKLASFKNQGVEKANIDKDGVLTYKGTYASIFRHKSLGDTTQSIPTGTTPTKVLAFSTNGNASNCTPDKTNDKITVTKKGRYLANLSLSYASGTATVNWTAYVFVNGVESDNIHSTGYTATANDKRSTSTSGIIDVTSVPCDVDYRVTHSAGASVNLIFSYVNLSLTYIGD